MRGRFKIEMPKPQETPNLNLDDKCKIKLTNDSEEIEIAARDLEVLEELGKGGFGVVSKMRHRQSGIIMAVKRISSSINDESQKRMLTELDACKRSDCCPQMVRFYGAMFREGDVWICMEVMDTSLDKFYKKCFALGRKLPEPFIGKVTLSVVEGLNFMKEQLNLIHRDVKPSNILLNRHGQMVRFYGAMFREGDVWICMEVMDTSLDKFYKKCFALGRKLPEPFIGKVTLSVVEGLNFMKEQLNLIHRDVKPSNILLNRHGQVKICDFGISGHLTNSLAKTIGAGCKFYMPPERIDGDMKDSYDVRADVWSLGITLVEIATGVYPYDTWANVFQQLNQVR
ncbi:kinase domain protein [Oesophagostomum dentatum]|uniref:mitogen-activated protein kinase kinase n=1 Tax=Oesophagostomum dentatum TaxID=61180 RepID=A0A0B1SJ95_OESDE|nr:kinase domain protein [Oesophagostomum dentatum]